MAFDVDPEDCRVALRLACPERFALRPSGWVVCRYE